MGKVSFIFHLKEKSIIFLTIEIITFQIGKMAEGRFSMDYESINERLSRLRKEAASPIRNKERAPFIPTLERQGSMDLEKIFKENKLKLDTLNTTTCSFAEVVSPRKIGIAKRIQNRCPTEESV